MMLEFGEEHEESDEVKVAIYFHRPVVEYSSGTVVWILRVRGGGFM